VFFLAFYSVLSERLCSGDEAEEFLQGEKECFVGHVVPTIMDIQ